MRRQERRIGRFEALERRALLAGCALPWLDVDNDGFVAPRDALIVINDLNSVRGAHPFDPFDSRNNEWLDVNFDQWVTPLDVLQIINDLNVNGSHPFVLECSSDLFVTETRGSTTDVAVSNEYGIVLSRGEFFADGTVNVTSMTFGTLEGSSRNIDRAALLVDTDGFDGVDTYVGSAFSSNDEFVFDTNVLIEDWAGAYAYEVRGDVGGSLSFDSSLRLGLKFVTAENSNGAVLAAENLHVQTTPQTLWTFVNQGDLFVTLDSTPTRSQHLLGGTLEEPILRVQFRAQNEGIDVSKLSISLTGTVASVDSLGLYFDGAPAPFAVATIAGVGSDPVPAGFTTFAAIMQNGQLVIPEGQDVDVIVRPRMKTDTNGMVSGEAVKASILTVGSFQPVLARGQGSSNNLLPNDGDAVNEGEVFVGVDTAGPNADIVGNSNVVVGSEFTDIRNANPAADGTAVPTGISPFAQFQFFAAMNTNTQNGLDKAALDSFVIYVEATNVLMDAAGFKVYNKADSSTKFGATVTNLAGVPLTGQVTGQLMVHVTGLSTSSVDAIFDSGEASTLVLEGNIIDPKINGAQSSSLQGSLDLTDQYFAYYCQDAGRQTLVRGSGLSETREKSTRYSS